MPDLPQYKDKAKIEPTPVTEASGVVSQSAAGWGMISDMGYRFAQNQANEMARINGTELGRTDPGRTLLPAIGEAGDVFNKAYKTQEYSTALTSGSRALDRLAFETLKNPNGQTLMSYDKQASQYINNISSQLTPENARLVKEQLEESAINSRYKIEHQIHEKALKENQIKFEDTYKTFGENIINSLAYGNFVGAEKELARANEYIDNPYTMPELGVEARKAIKKTLADLVEDNKIKIDIIKRAQKGESIEQLVDSYAQLPPTVKNLRKAKVALDALKEYSATTSSKDQVLAANATTRMIQEGGLPADYLAMLKTEMLPSRYAAFETQYAKFMRSQGVQENIAGFMDTYANNQAMLNTLSGSDLNKGWETLTRQESQRLQRPLSIEDEANLAQKYDIAVPSFNSKLSGGINSKDAKTASQYAGLYSALARNNPNVVAGVDNGTAIKAQSMADSIRFGENPDDAHKNANAGFGFLTPRDVKDSKDAFKENFRQKYGTGTNQQMTAIGNKMGFSNAAMRNNPPPGLHIDFVNMMEANYVQSRNWDKSEEITKQKIGQLYMETEHNGYKQVQRLPPTKFLPTEKVRELEIDYLNFLTGQQKILQQHPGVLAPFAYELDKDYKMADIEPIVIAPGIVKQADNPYRGKRIGVDYKGNPIEESGQFIFASDQFTDYPDVGQAPSWPLLFIPDNKLTPDLVWAPVLDKEHEFQGIQNARFMIPVNEFQSQSTVDRELMKEKERLANIVMNMAAMVGQVLPNSEPPKFEFPTNKVKRRDDTNR